MEDPRTQRLQRLLKQLGEAVHGSVASSEEVRARLQELRNDGWQAVMIVEASLACRDDGSVEVDKGTVRLHLDTDTPRARYRIDVEDARLLSALGISVGRHRSGNARVSRQPTDRNGESET